MMPSLLRRRLLKSLGLSPFAAAVAPGTAAGQAAPSRMDDYWRGKKIVWFGTSIPSDPGPEGNYPTLVGRMLGANVVNEAHPASTARTGAASRVDAAARDPFGWTGLAWQNAAWTLSGALDEKRALIKDWDFWKRRLVNAPPDVLTPAQQNVILNTSWERRLKRHLGEGARADLYVFDHGLNDFAVSPRDVGTLPANTRDRAYFLGAMNFLIDQILADDPRARIAFVGHYENAKAPAVSIAQMTLAKHWRFPLLPLWERLGWSQEQAPSGGASQTLLQTWLPDGVHPGSDSTGRSVRLIADVVATFVRDVR